MTGWLKRLRSTSMVLSLVAGALVSGLLLGGLFEQVQRPRLEAAFHTQLLAQQRDTQEAAETLFHQQILLLQRLLTISADRPEVTNALAGASQQTGSYPAWMPPVRYWRGLLFPNCFQLLDPAGEIRGSIAIDAATPCPVTATGSPVPAGRVHFIQAGGNEPWLLIEAPVSGRLGILRAGVRIDTNFLLRLFGSLLSKDAVLTVTEDRGQGPVVLAATRPDIPPMVPLDSLGADYLIGQPHILDEGDWDITLGFSVALRRDALAPLHRQALDLVAEQRLAMALGYVLLLLMVAWWAGRRLQHLHATIRQFADRILGEERPNVEGKHLIEQMRNDLETLQGLNDALGVRELAQRIEAERRQAELMEQMAEQMDIGLLEATPTPDQCLPLNATMRRYLDRLLPGACQRLMAAGDSPIVLKTRNGRRRVFEVKPLRNVGSDERTILLIRDITRWHRQQRKLERLATRDVLTGLPNRYALDEQVRQLIADRRRNRQVFCLLLFDIDDFKSINDHFGHNIGDQALVQVARNVSGLLRGQDFLVRLGGDEFVILLPETDIAGAEALARKLLDHQQHHPFSINDTPYILRLSIGACEWPRDGETLEALLSHADLAMYQAKRNRLGFARYDASLQRQDARRVQLLRGQQEAIDQGDITIEYQPQLDATTGEIHGWEALARWRHTELGPISPDEFIPLAEQAGLIGRVTRLVIERALADCAAWQRAGISGGVAINVSSFDLTGDGLRDALDAACAATGLEAALVTVELTESALMEDPLHAAHILASLDQAGYWTAIDDFGTGYSSLAYLQTLPVHELKIDRAFIAAARSDPTSRRIVESLLALAHSLDLSVVAEGVEDERDARWLINQGCDHLQGYWVGHPMPLEAILAGPHIPDVAAAGGT